ncbi:MAG: S46 family peptidase [Bacteroidales bacterium]|nr:S46 family peptidase [Bacteroidales bacterium]
MKKLICAIAALCMVATTALADEGMWLLPYLKQYNAKAMKSLGCKLSPKEIYDINHASLKDAIVHFGGGCTGEMISDEGLLVTNHHCGYSSIQRLSTPEHNYLEDGFWAMSRAQELPVPGLTVTFLVSMTDVTSVVDAAGKAVVSANVEAIENARNAAVEQLRKEAQDANPGCQVEITGFYNHNVFYLIISKVYKDVRFVGAPPASLGKFGGETDNWMWPRHTCDFSMFRVYAGADNMPAEYSQDNVPYRPAKSLAISLKGVKPGDFSFIMGYPGRTQRFQTADQLEDMMEGYGISVDARTVRQKAMLAGMESDPAIRLQYANKYASSANGWKKWQGEQLAFDKLNIIGRERQKEAEFMAWVNQDPGRQARYGQALQQISDAVSSSRQAGNDVTLLAESLYSIGTNSIVSTWFFTRQRALKEAPEDTLAAEKKATEAAIALFKDFDVNTEKGMATAMLEFFREKARPELYIHEIGDFANMDFGEYVDWLFETSAFASPEKLAALKYQDGRNDPAVTLYNAVVSKIVSRYPEAYGSNESLERASKDFAAGLLEWKKGQPSYPDANSTMRLTYGTVKPYSPKDGVIFQHYTTLNGVMEKEDPDNYEFRVPARLKSLWQARDYGQYADANGDLPTCFLTNNDITGGNSGSPVMNARGQLIGLAFDGNWESMSSDVMFEPDLQRCICVDIRYVLFIMDKFGGAGYLLDEMKIVK